VIHQQLNLVIKLTPHVYQFVHKVHNSWHISSDKLLDANEDLQLIEHRLVLLNTKPPLLNY